MRRRAYTLIEFLVAMALMGMVLAAAGSVLLQNLNSELLFRQQNNVQQGARTAIDLVADDLRGAVRNPALRKPDGTAVAFTAGTSTAPVNTVRGTGSSPTYTAPLYFDLCDDSGSPRRVRYWLNGTDLRREIVAGALNATTGNDSTTAAAASSATAGIVVARNVTSFTSSKPNGDSILRVVLRTQQIGNANQAANTTSPVTYQVDITLRNNLL